MKILLTMLFAFVLASLPAFERANAQTIRTLPVSACRVLSAHDFVVSGLPQPQLVMGGAMGCQFIWQTAQHNMTVTVRPLATLHSSDVLHANVCDSARAQAPPGGTCTPTSGYGRFGAVIAGIPGSGRGGAAIIFATARYQVSVAAMDPPGSAVSAVRRLGKILASRFH